MSTTLSAFAAFARVGWRGAAADRLGLLGRALLFSLPVLIFAAIWRATPLAGSAYDADRLTWYIMVTETIIFAPGYAFREIEEDIRTGAIEAALARPLPYVLARVGEEAGGTLLRLIVLAPVGVTLAWLTTTSLPLAPSAVPALLLCAAAGALIAMLFQVAIGLLTAWVGNPAPAYWIWQKLTFVLGGLFLPLTLYPSWLRDLGQVTPGAAILFHPASLVLDSEPAAQLRVIAIQAFWLVFAGLLVALVAAAATRRFVREGV